MTTHTFNIGDNVTVKLTGKCGNVNAALYDYLPDGSDLLRIESAEACDQSEAWFEPRYLEMTDSAVLPMPGDERIAA